MKIYLKLICKHIFNLGAIDIVVFSILINQNFTNLITREIQILISILILRKYLLNHEITKSLESILFITGAKVRIVVLLNLFFNNIIFHCCPIKI